MKFIRIGTLLFVTAILAAAPAVSGAEPPVNLLGPFPSPAPATNDRPDNIRPWVPSVRSSSRPTTDTSRQSYFDRTRATSEARRADHEATQYGSDIAGARYRLEREYRTDRRSFDRLQRLRREESRMRSFR